MKKAVVFVLMSCTIIRANAGKVQNDKDSLMQWFSDAKLGIFIHWGIYSTGKTSESWAFHNRQISYTEYMKQIDEFTASQYNPSKWVELIKVSGARYTVVTSKHHDGVALWNTNKNKLSIPEASPAKMDVLTPFVNELRKANLKVGLYYSLIDWSHSDYPGFLRDSSRYKIQNEPKRWSGFLKFCHGQISELLTQYNPDLMWFDGDWEHTADEWKADKIRQLIKKNNTNTIINGRLQGYGDYETPEQNIPITRPANKNWELCMTTNESWGYFIGDNNYKTPYEIISIFTECISNGGNLLLDICPQADGTIPEEQIYLLFELGQWNKKHEEAIFGTISGLPLGHFYGPTTLSKDSSTVFLFLQGNQRGNIIIKGLNNTIKKIEVVGNGQLLEHKIVGKISWSHIPGLVFIDIPEGVQDKYMTVLRVDLDGPVSLYRGKGGFE